MARKPSNKCKVCNTPTKKVDLLDFTKIDSNHYGHICIACAEDYKTAKQHTFDSMEDWFFVEYGRKWNDCGYDTSNTENWIKFHYADEFYDFVNNDGYEEYQAIDSIIQNFVDTWGDYIRDNKEVNNK